MYVAPVQHKLCGGLALEQLSCVISQPALSLVFSPKSANLILSTQLQSSLFSFCNLDLPSLLRKLHFYARNTSLYFSPGLAPLHDLPQLRLNIV